MDFFQPILMGNVFSKNRTGFWKFSKQLISVRFVEDVHVTFEKYSIMETLKT